MWFNGELYNYRLYCILKIRTTVRNIILVKDKANCYLLEIVIKWNINCWSGIISFLVTLKIYSIIIPHLFSLDEDIDGLYIDTELFDITGNKIVEIKKNNFIIM